MNVESMRYFVELSRAGSFYAAAKGLFMSQQGLNKAVTAMEEELGVKLVERSRRGVILTRDGESFLQLAESTVQQFDAYMGNLYESDAGAGRGADPMTVHVTYYSAQIAGSSQEYVNMLGGTAYLEEPFEKLLARARVSDGSDLSYVDIHGPMAAKVLSDPGLAFDLTLVTRVGVVCRKDSPLAGKSVLHRQDVCNLPVAANAFKEMSQLIEWLFRDAPLTDVRMSAANPKMLLRFARANRDGVAFYDSFGFRLSSQDPSNQTDDLTFIPLSTPASLCYVGFLYPKHVRPAPRVLHTAKALENYLQTKHADYFKEYPLVVG